MSLKYLIFEDYETGLDRAEVEGRAMNLPFYSTDPNVNKGVSMYRTSPKLLKNGKYALEVSDYVSLTSEEDLSTVTKVTFPDPEM